MKAPTSRRDHVMKENSTPELSYKPEDYAAIYARKSIKAENSSIKSQLSLARDVLYKNNLFLYKEYWDEESATKLPYYKRQGFSELLKDAKNGKFKTVIVFRRDRLARRANDLIEIKNLFKKYKIKIIYSNTGEYQPSESYLSDFIENIIMAVDELEPQIVAERTMTGKIKKRERKEYFCSKLPYGFTRTEHDEKTIYVCEDSKKHILEAIFENYASINDNYRLSNLVKEINAEYDASNSLTSNKVQNIIKNPIYAGKQFKDSSKELFDLFTESENGDFCYNPDLLQTCINVIPIIDFELWSSCLKVWRANYKHIPKTKKTTYLFKGILFCGSCNKPIYLISGKYKCRSSNCSSFDSLYLQKELIRKIVSDITANGGLEKYIEIKISCYKSEIHKFNRKLKSIMADLDCHTIKFIKNYGDNKSNYLKKQLNDLLQKQEKVKKQVSSLDDKIFKLNECCNNIIIAENSGLTLHLLANTEKSQNLIKFLIDKVIVNGKDNSLSIQII